jgi:hypothetical protein
MDLANTLSIMNTTIKGSGCFWNLTLILAAGVLATFTSALRAQQTAALDSIVQLTAEADGLNLVSAVPTTGTFWIVTADGITAPMPFLPPTDQGLPTFAIKNNVFLVDATAGEVDLQWLGATTTAEALEILASQVENVITQTLTPPATTRQSMLAMSGGMEFGFQPMAFTTNNLWLQMLSVTDGTANLVIYPPWNVSNGVYDLLYCTNLASPTSWQWLLRSDPGQTNLAVANATDAQGFYRLSSPNDIMANDSLGTNFWIAFCNLADSIDDDYLTANLSVCIASPLGATGSVTIPGLGITTNFSVAVGAVTNINIPTPAMITNYDVIVTNGIHITANQPVAVYGLDYNLWASTAFTCYPTRLLGTNFCVMARASSIAGYAGFDIYSQLAIVAAESNTTVTITPSVTANLEGHTNAYTITNLQPGLTYQINSHNNLASDYTNDVTGTWIASDKPIAVFAGDNLAYVPDAYTHTGNPLMQEQMPVEDWDTQALAMSFAGRQNGDTYRVLVANSNTVVSVTGTVVTPVSEPQNGPWTVTTTNETLTTNLMAGVPFDVIVDGPVVFQANQPIQVAQFANGTWSDHGAIPYEGDPCEILLPPTGRYLETNIVVTLTNDLPNQVIGDFDENFLNLIVPQSATNSTRVDGSLVAASNYVAIGTSGYCGAQITITNSGAHTVTSSQPVGVEVYGWGQYDAYGYFGGIVK